MKKFKPLLVIIPTLILILVYAFAYARIMKLQANKPLVFTFNEQEVGRIYASISSYNQLIPKSHMPIDTGIIMINMNTKILKDIEAKYKVLTDTVKVKADTIKTKIKDGKGKGTKGSN